MSYTKQETILKVENVSKAFDGKQILRDINLEIKNIVRDDCPTQGQVVSLIGKSGCGKSTLLNILSSLLNPDTGNVTVEGQPIAIGDMGVVFQNYYIYPWRTVKQILMMAARENTNLKTKALQHKYVLEMANELNILDHLDKYPFQLSGGQKQRVAICEEIVNGCDFILLDEPFSGLDSITIDKVMNILVKVSLMDDLKTIIIVSHDLSNSLAISDTAYIIGTVGDTPGATITHEIDLLERGFAWRKDVKDDPAFRSLINEVKSYL